MNELEQWLADVKDFNLAADQLFNDGTNLVEKRDRIEARGKSAGLTKAKIKSMLARVKLKVEMPEETGK